MKYIFIAIVTVLAVGWTALHFEDLNLGPKIKVEDDLTDTMLALYRNRNEAHIQMDRQLFRNESHDRLTYELTSPCWPSLTDEDWIRLVKVTNAPATTVADAPFRFVYFGFRPMSGSRPSPALLDALIEKGLDVDRIGPAGSPLLIEAIHLADLKLVEGLLKHGASISKANDFGWTPAQVARYFGDARIITTLADRMGADTDDQGAFGRRAIKALSEPAALDALLNSCRARLVEYRDFRGNSLLALALRKKALDAARRLGALEKPSVRTNWNGDSVLHAAAEANIWLSEFESPDFEHLYDHSNEVGWTSLMVAAKNGSIGFIEGACRAGADPDKLGVRNRSALHIAAIFHREDACRALISNGARTDLVDANGKTAEDYRRAYYTPPPPPPPPERPE